ncbi:MAG TPA: DUF5615 family PIN-like protein [Solirubrobacteraceae bacterium]|nr:DUF5615 family PIN-like protein [Solirubrobacteraceae bacterium]
MKLLLDEMYPPSIAEQLRRRGHDVHAVTARAELRTLPDAEIFAVAQRERRVVVTENIDDFSAIADSHDRRGQAHHGLILVTPRHYPRGNPRTIGQMVTALAKLLDDQPGTTPTSLRHWL